MYKGESTHNLVFSEVFEIRTNTKGKFKQTPRGMSIFPTFSGEMDKFLSYFSNPLDLFRMNRVGNKSP